MFKIAICDDERIIRKEIANMVKEIMVTAAKAFEIIEFEYGEELLNHTYNFDIILLDIKLEGLCGIEIAQKLRESKIDSIIIFITSMKEFALQAFDVSAFHYLVKPVSFVKLETALLAAIGQIKQDAFLIIETRNQTHKVNLKEVLYFEVNNRIISVHKANEQIEYYYKIGDLEKALDSNIFFRCHKSYLVNLQHVIKYDKQSITLYNNEIIYLSKRKYQQFSTAFMYYIKRKRGL